MNQLTLQFDKTQTGRLLDHFKRGGTITSLEAYIDLGITQLARCVDDLQKEGYEFNKPRIKLPSGKNVCRYSLRREPGL